MSKINGGDGRAKPVAINVSNHSGDSSPRSSYTASSSNNNTSSSTPPADPPVYDVTLSVPSHGIHHPTNLHSFRPYTAILPAECPVCRHLVLPLTAGASCVRCAMYCHRGCLRNITNVCPKFITEIPAAVTIKSAEELKHFKSSDDGDHHGRSVHATSATAEPDWDAILAEISTTVAKVQFDLKEHPSDDELISEINKLLSNTSSFPGAVSSIIRRTYLKHMYTNDAVALSEARSALDRISYAVCSVLPMHVTDDHDLMHRVVNIVDRALLSKNDNGMYEKIMAHAAAMARENDEALLKHLSKFAPNVHDERIIHETGVVEAFFRVVSCVTSTDKLDALSNALRVCVSAELPIIHVNLEVMHGSTPSRSHGMISHASSHAVGSPGPSASGSNDVFHSPLHPSHKSSSASSHGSVHGPRTPFKAPSVDDTSLDVSLSKATGSIGACGADVLIERLIFVISSLTRRYKIHWHAQCIFIESMCHDGAWLIGAEGYSLVSLQQVLTALSPRSRGNSLASLSRSFDSEDGARSHLSDCIDAQSEQRTFDTE